MAHNQVTPALEVLADREALARRAADWLLSAVADRSGTFAIALAGGSTPRRLYELLATPLRRDAFPWHKVHWFWGDERFVPHADARSNYRMVQEALLSRAPVPPANVHPIPTEGVTPDAAAATYSHELKAFYGAEQIDPSRPLFDVTLLGLGADGHTASLFPDTAALDEHERWATAVAGVQPETRITLTYPVLESCRHAAFLVAGADKRAAFARLRNGDTSIPAGRFKPGGEVRWFADAAAAGDDLSS